MEAPPPQYDDPNPFTPNPTATKIEIRMGNLPGVLITDIILSHWEREPKRVRLR